MAYIYYTINTRYRSTMTQKAVSDYTARASIKPNICTRDCQHTHSADQSTWRPHLNTPSAFSHTSPVNILPEGHSSHCTMAKMTFCCRHASFVYRHLQLRIIHAWKSATKLEPPSNFISITGALGVTNQTCDLGMGYIGAGRSRAEVLYLSMSTPV